MRVLSAADIHRLLPMKQCIEIMDSAMRAVSSGNFSIPLRMFIPLADSNAHLGLMPGSIPNLPVYGAKIISLHPGNPASGVPAIQGFVALFDKETGTPAALVDGAAITAIRTAAASALATRVLARCDASSHGVFGTGVQAATHIEAIACVRDIDSVLVWARDMHKAKQFAVLQSERTGLDVSATQSAEKAASCDIVSTVTGATEPVLEGTWLMPGAHVNLVGAHTPTTREADSETLRRASIYVDLLESARIEAGDILIPIEEGSICEQDIVGEIGQVLARDIGGRNNDEQITLYISLGIVVQDLFAASYVLDAAETIDAGTTVSLS